MPHFFINSKSYNNGKITISDKENFNHIARALHSKVGETLLLIDENKIQYETKIEEIKSGTIIANVETSYKSSRTLPLNLYLAQVAIKKEAQADIIQKACELGVKGIYPLVSDNCTIKKSYVKEKIEKYNKLSYEASKQCERPDVADVFEPRELDEILKSEDFDTKIVCVEKYAKTSLKTYLKNKKLPPNSKILVIIGPEGGFSEREFNLMKKLNLPMVSLGNLILRADTAVVTALSDVIYEFCE